MAARWQGRTTAAVVDITPATPAPLAGSAAQTTPFTAVADPLEASILVVEAAPSPLVMVSFDLLFVGPEIERALRERLRGRLPADNLLLFASHTHGAPATDPTKPRLGAVDGTFVAMVAERVGSAILTLLDGDGWQETRARVGTTRRRFAVRRRVRRLATLHRRAVRVRPVVQGSDRRAVIDDLLVAVRVEEAETRRPLAVLWSLACHPVGYPRPAVVSAHFPGVVRRHLREALAEPSLPVLYLQGFSGDLRPRAASTMRPARSGLERLRLGDAFSSFDEKDYADWAEQIATTVERTSAAAAPLEGEGVLLRAATLPRDGFLVGSVGEGPIEFRSVQIGTDLQILAVSAEVVSGYDRPVRELGEASTIILAGCLGDVPGYVPTERMLAEGGYEACDFCVDFGADHVPAGVEERLLEGFRRVTGAT